MASPLCSANSNHIDIEAQLPCREPFSQTNEKPGLPALLKFTTVIDQSEHLAVFRRFGDLNILSILCLQADLLHLRSKLASQPKDLIVEDAMQRTKDNGLDLKPFLDFGEGLTPELELLEKIREKMVKYSLFPPFIGRRCTRHSGAEKNRCGASNISPTQELPSSATFPVSTCNSVLHT